MLAEIHHLIQTSVFLYKATCTTATNRLCNVYIIIYVLKLKCFWFYIKKVLFCKTSFLLRILNNCLH